MLMINKGVYNHPSKRFAREGFKEAATRKSIHGDSNSRIKLPCSSIESFPSDSRVSASLDSLAQIYPITRGSSWKIMVVPRSWLRTTKCGLEGRGSNSIEYDEVCSSIIFLNKFCLGQGFAEGFSKEGVVKVIFPSYSCRFPRGAWWRFSRG